MIFLNLFSIIECVFDIRVVIFVLFCVFLEWESIVELVGIGVWGCSLCIWGLYSLWEINGRVSIDFFSVFIFEDLNWL